MKSLIKLLIISLIVSLFSAQSFAQGNIGLGLNISSGAVNKIDGQNYKAGLYGINLRSSFNIAKKWDIVPSLNYAFPKTESNIQGSTKTQFLHLDINSHYLFSPKWKFCPYGIIGASALGWYIKDDRVFTSPGGIEYDRMDVDEYKISYAVNLGVGFKLEMKHNLTMFTELKYGIGPTGQFLVAAGVYYNFK